MLSNVRQANLSTIEHPLIDAHSIEAVETLRVEAETLSASLIAASTIY
jgi:hypothetical protein